jgi:hypothetical protein
MNTIVFHAELIKFCFKGKDCNMHTIVVNVSIVQKANQIWRKFCLQFKRIGKTINIRNG